MLHRFNAHKAVCLQTKRSKGRGRTAVNVCVSWFPVSDLAKMPQSVREQHQICSHCYLCAESEVSFAPA